MIKRNDIRFVVCFVGLAFPIKYLPLPVELTSSVGQGSVSGGFRCQPQGGYLAVNGDMDSGGVVVGLSRWVGAGLSK